MMRTGGMVEETKAHTLDGKISLYFSCLLLHLHLHF